MQSDGLRKAVEAKDHLDATLAQLSSSIVMRTPVAPDPFVGKAAVADLFAALFQMFEDFRFVGAYSSPDGGEVLHFEWRLDDRDVEGVDMMHFDAQGLIEDYRVMVRPLPAVLALRDAVFSQLDL